MAMVNEREVVYNRSICGGPIQTTFIQRECRCYPFGSISIKSTSHSSTSFPSVHLLRSIWMRTCTIFSSIDMSTSSLVFHPVTFHLSIWALQCHRMVASLVFHPCSRYPLIVNMRIAVSILSEYCVCLLGVPKLERR